MDGTHFIAMELVSGETVRELLASGPIPFRKAVAIAAQIADALAQAHEIGIVHRDLKPDNLMVSGDGYSQEFWISAWRNCSRSITPRIRMLPLSPSRSRER